jgi:hypothetical protein
MKEPVLCIKIAGSFLAASNKEDGRECVRARVVDARDGNGPLGKAGTSAIRLPARGTCLSTTKSAISCQNRLLTEGSANLHLCACVCGSTRSGWSGLTDR